MTTNLKRLDFLGVTREFWSNEVTFQHFPINFQKLKQLQISNNVDLSYVWDYNVPYFPYFKYKSRRDVKLGPDNLSNHF